MNTPHTDEQLKRALALMLPPNTLNTREYYGEQQYYWIQNGVDEMDCEVLRDTELLHLCWLVEETLDADGWNNYIEYVSQQVHSIYNREHMLHATWQQRTIALAKVKGVEIV